MKLTSEHIHILCACNEKFASICGVMLTSVFKNNPQSDAYILTDSVFRSSILKKYSQLEDRYCTKIHFILVNSDLYKSFASQRNSVTTFFRLFASILLPKELHRVLYLDCDIIVDGNLDELWNTDLKDKSVAVVPDVQYHKADHSIRLDLPKDNIYFNAGVLLINLEYWRSRNLLRFFYDVWSIYGTKLKYKDQDVLNKVCYDSKVLVDINWNFFQWLSTINFMTN